jgi:hypothetical protein
MSSQNDLMPGWDTESWGYHGDDGKKFGDNDGQGWQYGPTYGNGDTVGCGFDYIRDVFLARL